MTRDAAHRSLRRRSRWRAFTIVSALGAVLSAGLLSHNSLGAGVARADATAAAPAFTKSETLTRRDLTADGQEKVQDTRTVTLTVDRTSGLRNLDGINVTWSGAHPTSNITADFNGDNAQYDDYPMVLLECRGSDAPPAGGTQLSPQTCWTDAADERSSFETNTSFPPWRLDRYATEAGARPTRFLNVPSEPACEIDPAEPEAAYDIPIDGANDTAYDAAGWRFVGCGTLAPEELRNGYPQGDPDNLTWGITSADGTGSALFRTWTGDTNATLGCSSEVPCSLVAVPIMGVSCNESLAADADGSTPSATDITSCEDQSSAAGTYVTNAGTGDIAMDGQLWWSPSNWNNRIVVPLTFDPPPATCTNSANGTVYAFGSELISQVAPQWAAEFCTDSTKTPFQAVAAPEPQAASQLASGQIEAAFLTDPPDPATTTQPIVSAPVAISGFAIAVDVDDANRKPATTIKLDARLLAKLLTWSYYDNSLRASQHADRVQPGQHVYRPRVSGAEPGCVREPGQSCGDVVDPIDAVGRDTRLDGLYKRRSRSALVARRDTGPLGYDSQPRLQGNSASDIHLAASGSVHSVPLRRGWQSVPLQPRPGIVPPLHIDALPAAHRGPGNTS